MSDIADVYITLRSELARVYWTAELAKVQIQDADIDPIKIQLQGIPEVVWNNILLQALRENKMKVLLDRASSGKPSLEDLRTQFL